MQVVSSAVLSMSAEVASTRKRLAELLQRRDEIQRELEEAQLNNDNHEDDLVDVDNNANNQMNRRAGVQRQSSLPAKLQTNQHLQDNQFQFPDPDTYYGHSAEDNLDNHDQDNQWIFSPRSASPTSEFQGNID